jgi:heme/copper-type cytochrome/quinol oxidase subunit 2
MYCASCGVAVTKGLSYCNQCGAKLSGAKSESAAKSPELFSDSMVWAIVSVFIVGLGCIIGLMAMMKELLNFSEKLIVMFSLMSFLLMFVIEGVLIWTLLSRKRESRATGEAGQLGEQTTKELGPAQARAFTECMGSVTEHTTRSFEPVYSERKAE